MKTQTLRSFKLKTTQRSETAAACFLKISKSDTDFNCAPFSAERSIDLTLYNESHSTLGCAILTEEEVDYIIKVLQTLKSNKEILTPDSMSEDILI